MAITLSEAAAAAVKEILMREKKEHWGLHVGVSGGGCSGLNYELELQEGAKDGDHLGESHGIPIFCDAKSYLHLNGTEIDYVTSMLGGGFRFNNPNAKRTCGCGTSFSPE